MFSLKFPLTVITSNNTYIDSYIKGIDVSTKLLNIDGKDYDYNIDTYKKKIYVYGISADEEERA